MAKVNGGSQAANLKIPQNSAGFVPAVNINKKDPAPKKTTGNDLRSK